MKHFLTILNNKLTLGLLLGIISSFLYAIILKFSLEHLLDIFPTKGGLDIKDISYFFSAAFWRFFFDIFLQWKLGEYYHITLCSLEKKSDPSTLFTNTSNSSHSNENLSSNKSKDIEKSDFDAAYKWQEQMMANLKYQNSMMQKLLDLKRLHDLKYFEVNGALQLDAPASISDSQLIKLSNEIGIIDRIINTKAAEYSALEERFQKNSCFSQAAKKSISDYKELHSLRYKNLFEK